MRKYFLYDGVEISGPKTIDEINNPNLQNQKLIWYYGLNQWINLSESNDAKIKSILIHQSTQINRKSFKFLSAKTFTFLFAFIIFLISIISIIKYNSYNSVENKTRRKSFDSTDDLTIYLNKFYRDLEYYGIKSIRPEKIEIKMSHLDRSSITSDAHAISLGLNDDSKIEIYINHSSWTNLTRPQKYLLMYHELGHDVLNLEHTDITVSNNIEIMNPILYRFNNISMDDFIEASQSMFLKLSNHKK